MEPREREDVVFGSRFSTEGLSRKQVKWRVGSGSFVVRVKKPHDTLTKVQYSDVLHYAHPCFANAVYASDPTRPGSYVSCAAPDGDSVILLQPGLLEAALDGGPATILFHFEEEDGTKTVLGLDITALPAGSPEKATPSDVWPGDDGPHGGEGGSDPVPGAEEEKEPSPATPESAGEGGNPDPTPSPFIDLLDEKLFSVEAMLLGAQEERAAEDAALNKRLDKLEKDLLSAYKEAVPAPAVDTDVYKAPTFANLLSALRYDAQQARLLQTPPLAEWEASPPRASAKPAAARKPASSGQAAAKPKPSPAPKEEAASPPEDSAPPPGEDEAPPVVAASYRSYERISWGWWLAVGLLAAIAVGAAALALRRGSGGHSGQDTGASPP